MEFKNLFATSLHGRPVIIENHYHCLETRSQLAMPDGFAELPGESSTVRAELPGYSVHNAHAEYLAGMEDTPPAVDISTKPSMKHMKGYAYV